jgi:hypothetical protein
LYTVKMVACIMGHTVSAVARCVKKFSSDAILAWRLWAALW